jgi:site-specific DNA-cytosine methylase|tara:strand:+ start:994 stop:1416 length:423 start_codon:yes stop_codon:yes gene_type:complete
MNRVTLALTLLCLASCSTPQQSWPNQSKEVVWTAMVAVANSPDYGAPDPRKRWIVVKNKVDANSQTGKILVNRTIARSLQLPLQIEQNEERSWLFDIQLLPNQIPTVTFDTVKQPMVPAQVHDEANRYFEQINELIQLDE